MTDRARRPWSSMLSVRFAAMLTIALLPIGLVSYLQSRILAEEVQARADDGLLGTTLRVASAQTNVIRSAQGMMSATARAVPYLADKPEQCSELMREIALANPDATLVAFIPISGTMQCSNQDIPYDFSKNPKFSVLRDARVPSFLVSRNGAVSHTSVLAITHPVFNVDGAYLGFVVIALPHASLTEPLAQGDPSDGSTQQMLFFWSFDRTGELTAASVDLEYVKEHIPAIRTLSSLVGQPAQVFQDVTQFGLPRTYAVVPVLDGQLYLMSSWRVSTDTLADQFRQTAYVSPLLMWFVGLIVAAVGAERLVTRHVRKLNRAIVSFTRGDRRLETVELRNSSIELRELGEAYVSMTEAITRGEAALEDNIHQMEVLLREVHHRVKNNLQLIASIMNLQMRKTSNPDSKILLKDLRDRVMSLATIHRDLYQTSGMADVQANELLPDIVRQVTGLSGGSDRVIEVDVDIQEIPLVPDQAVPLSLLLTEAVSMAVKHSSGPLQVKVTFARHKDDQAVLSVTSHQDIAENAASGDRAREADELSGQLMSAFSHQLGGTLRVDHGPGSYSSVLTFPLAPLSAAEYRRDPAFGQ